MGPAPAVSNSRREMAERQEDWADRSQPNRFLELVLILKEERTRFRVPVVHVVVLSIVRSELAADSRARGPLIRTTGAFRSILIEKVDRTKQEAVLKIFAEEELSFLR